MRLALFLSAAMAATMPHWLSPTFGQEKLQGVCYGPHRDNESPLADGLEPLPSELEQDIAFASTVTKCVRTYSVAGTLGLIPELCEKQGLDCYPGCWIGRTAAANDLEVELLIRIARRSYSHVKGVVVGNEVMHRKDLTEEELIKYVRRVKLAVKVPVAVADTASTWLNHKELAKGADVLMVQVYPYWEGVGIERAAEETLRQVKEVQNAQPGVPIILSEFGWPSAGETRGSAVASAENQARYIREVLPLLESESVPWLYFSLFDEKWKAQQEQEVGAHWGLFDSQGTMKFALKPLLPPTAIPGIQRLPRPTGFAP